MKALMYHYVRPPSGDLPHLQYLHIDNFRRQLDWIDRNIGFASKVSFQNAVVSGKTCPGAVLTFDDAFSDHFEFVYPELRRRGLWGIFYIPTSILESGRLLNVHRIHAILGRCGGAAAWDATRRLVTNDMLSHHHIDEFRKLTYARQYNTEAVNLTKRTLNYFISYEFRDQVLDQLMVEIFGARGETELARTFYLSSDQIREMHAGGMVLGSHSVYHPVMSKLPEERQRDEINSSFDVLEDLLKTPIETFCYPYGGFHSFTDATERLLQERGCRYAFNVEQRDISDADLQHRPQALPRYDCNQFPFGSPRDTFSNNVE